MYKELKIYAFYISAYVYKYILTFPRLAVHIFLVANITLNDSIIFWSFLIVILYRNSVDKLVESLLKIDNSIESCRKTTETFNVVLRREVKKIRIKSKNCLKTG